MFENGKEISEAITKEIVEQYISLLDHSVDKFDIQMMYVASADLCYRKIHTLISRCTLTGDLGDYYNLVLNVEYYKEKYGIQ